MNKTIQGVLVEEGAAFVNKYFLLPTDTKASDTITLSLDEGELEEGYYHMSAKVCLDHVAGTTELPAAACGPCSGLMALCLMVCLCTLP
jgi:hypothetical protein